MEQLYDKARVNESQLKRLLLNIVSKELANLATPCYSSPIKSQYYQILRLTGLKEPDLKKFANEFYKGTKAQTLRYHFEPSTNLLLFIMNYALKNNNLTLYTSALLYLLVRYHTNSFFKFLKKYCDEKTFRYTLDKLTKTHLFSREKTISGGLLYLAKELEKKHTKAIRDLDPVNVAKFIAEARHRINQSWRGFAGNYYSNYEKGLGIGTQTEPESEDDEAAIANIQKSERGLQTIQQVIRRIIINREVDRKAMEEAKRITKVKSSIAIKLSDKIRDVRYSQQLEMIYRLFTKELKSANDLCGRGFESFVKKLMAVKRTRAEVYFKQQITQLTEQIVKDTKSQEWFQELTPQTKFSIYAYLAFYLTYFFKNTLC
jgi:hypothetical protein